jgi:hypothetical protein
MTLYVGFNIVIPSTSYLFRGNETKEGIARSGNIDYVCDQYRQDVVNPHVEREHVTHANPLIPQRRWKVPLGGAALNMEK